MGAGVGDGGKADAEAREPCLSAVALVGRLVRQDYHPGAAREGGEGRHGAVDGRQGVDAGVVEARDQGADFAGVGGRAVGPAADIAVQAVGRPVEIQSPAVEEGLETAHEVGDDLVGVAYVCGGDKLDHGSGGICPAAGGVKLCHL